MFLQFIILTNILWNQGAGSQAKVQQIFHRFNKYSYVRGVLPVFPDQHFPMEGLLAIGMSILITDKMSFPASNHTHIPNAPFNSWTIGEGLREKMDGYNISKFTHMHVPHVFGERFPFVSDPLEFQSARSLYEARNTGKKPFPNMEFVDFISHQMGGASETLRHGGTIAESLVGNYVSMKKFLTQFPEGQKLVRDRIAAEGHEFDTAGKIWNFMDRDHFDEKDTVRNKFCDAKEQALSFRLYEPKFFSIPEPGHILKPLRDPHIGIGSHAVSPSASSFSELFEECDVPGFGGITSEEGRCKEKNFFVNSISEQNQYFSAQSPRKEILYKFLRGICKPRRKFQRPSADLRSF
jgi:hypothetical protein